VLPDASTWQNPGTLARKLSRHAAPRASVVSSGGARRVWRGFCHPGTNFIEHYACRGTSLIEATNLSPVTKLIAGTGAVSRYNLSRSQKTVTMQDLSCGQMRALPNVAQRSWVSGCNGHYEFVLGAEVKAKSVTNYLPILSVLGVRGVI
jgi:hypothetical protein